jgi:hypothetical protein
MTKPRGDMNGFAGMSRKCSFCLEDLVFDAETGDPLPHTCMQPVKTGRKGFLGLFRR